MPSVPESKPVDLTVNQPIPLDYEDARRSSSEPAVIAMVLGLCSGPNMVVVGVIATLFSRSIFVGGAIGVFIALYCFWIHIETPVKLGVRGRHRALIGLVATILWAVGLVALLHYLDANFE